MTDLSAAGLADVGAFFRTYYVPNNAILCVAGDFQAAQAKEWIEKSSVFAARHGGESIASPTYRPCRRRNHIRTTRRRGAACAVLVRSGRRCGQPSR